MALAYYNAMFYFLQESLKGETFAGKSLLMLGNQTLKANRFQCYAVAKRMGVKLADVKLDESMQDSEGEITSKSFFEALGFSEIHAMDVSDYENADVIYDLNSRDLPKELWNRYDYIIDGGTTEHVFHASHVLENIVKMLKIGGRVYHIVPAYGAINHGFYTFSPSFFEKFYKENGFVVESLNIILFNKDAEIARETSEEKLLPKFYEENLMTIDLRLIDSPTDNFELLNKYAGDLRCIAKKINNLSQPINVPIQKDWYVNWEELLGKGLMVSGAGLRSYGKGEIGIWGMGKIAGEFISLLKKENFPIEKIRGFFSSDTKEKSFQGFPVLDKSQVDSYGIKVILIASARYEDEIYKSIKYLEDHGIKIVRFNKYIPYLLQS